LLSSIKQSEFVFHLGNLRRRKIRAAAAHRYAAGPFRLARVTISTWCMTTASWTPAILRLRRPSSTIWRHGIFHDRRRSRPRAFHLGDADHRARRNRRGDAAARVGGGEGRLRARLRRSGPAPAQSRGADSRRKWAADVRLDAQDFRSPLSGREKLVHKPPCRRQANPLRGPLGLTARCDPE
jgi:hypothetical protein